MKKVAAIEDTEWESGMYYPVRWDPEFSEFMTLERLIHYPVAGFRFQLKAR